MPRLTRAESQARTRELILESARQAFARVGYAGASIDLICEGAGFSKGAFYSNFPGKEQLFLELLAQHMAAELEELNRVLGAGGPGLQAALDAWLEALNSDADWALLSIELQLHARRHPAFAQAYDALYRNHRAALGKLVGRLFRGAGLQLPAPAEQLASALMALAHGLALQRPPSARAAADPAGRLIKLFLGGLFASAQPLKES